MTHALFCRACAAREWKGWGTALKPSHEPIVVARRQIDGTVSSNLLTHGVGALNIDSCRIEGLVQGPGTTPGSTVGGRRGSMAGTMDRTDYDGSKGRWPANVIHDGSPEVLEAFAQFGDNKGQSAHLSTRNSDKTRNTFGAFGGSVDAHFAPHDELGSAARFFYCAKASRADRNEGIGGSDTPAVENEATMRDRETADWQERNGNHHPTVKPTDLMAYLCRLVTPQNGLVLDPFMGSGSTGKAAMREGFRFIGIDMTPEYVGIARARIAHELESVTEQQRIAAAQGNLFAA
jgi:hypothetical protein